MWFAILIFLILYHGVIIYIELMDKSGTIYIQSQKRLIQKLYIYLNWEKYMVSYGRIEKIDIGAVTQLDLRLNIFA